MTARARHTHHAPHRSDTARAAIAVAGELVVTFGVMVLAYLFWLFVWTTWVAEHQAAESMDFFRGTITAAATTPAVLHTDDPPLIERPAAGQTFGILHVPRWDGLTTNTMPIVEGTGRDILDRANAGHYVTTALPGQVGNMAVAGHRRTYGNSFRYVDRLHSGDALIIETAATWYVYRVTGAEIVTPDQWDVTAPVPRHPDQLPTERLLTLTTCHSVTQGEYGNDHRWIVYAEFAGWLSRSEGTPAELGIPTAASG